MTQVYLFDMIGISAVALHSTLLQGSTSSVILWPCRLGAQHVINRGKDVEAIL